MGEKAKEVLKLQFDKRLRLEFHGARITSDAGLLACRELDGVLGLMEMAPTYLQDTRGGKNVNILRINVQYREQDEEYDAIQLGDAIKQREARDAYLEANPVYALVRRQREAYELGIPKKHFHTYTDWRLNPVYKKPDDYPDNVPFWEDDWFMMEHPEFYKEVYLGILGNEQLDFRKVPMTKDGKPNREIGAKYLNYKSLDTRMERDQYRLDNPDPDEWGVFAGIWKTTMSEKRKAEEMTPSEKWREYLEEEQKKFREELPG